MTYYVKRSKPDGSRVGWVGPLRSYKRAKREADAWLDCDWNASVVESSSEVRAKVRAWQKEADRRRAWNLPE